MLPPTEVICILHQAQENFFRECMCPANERRRYIVTSSLIGWVHTQTSWWFLSLSSNRIGIYSVFHQICRFFCCSLTCCSYILSVHNGYMWCICPYFSGLPHWHRGSQSKCQPWIIWIKPTCILPHQNNLPNHFANIILEMCCMYQLIRLIQKIRNHSTLTHGTFGICSCNIKLGIFNHMSWINILTISGEIVLRWM